MYYPATFTPDTNDTFLVAFRDIPEAVGVGETFEIAYQSALDGLETAFSIYMDERKPIPAPSELSDGEHAIYLPVAVQTKLALYHEMLAQGVTKAELARRLSVNQKQIDRLWDVSHSTKLEFLEKAFSVLGKRLSLAI
ncbi:type II toxin-antitoxin system HicB family antitoxin [Moraxella bovis]|uniref:Type II toxin-antitoxin system HicB family antitoxin n=1 Tax=Moraxella bovis TaxID=476 RepID=A0AAX3EQV4_MORBO|nr:type II toxin-antitoxin system HicB family antitoxin [Moraxella bovis]UYZ74522.1 type II toxin-antitoxin system HicB family antitoxin [Moraxella bovis]UYZ79552.1 type II toxin-antitoxin system HicB family antitoxin [Moraxella bovis]UYZ79849.1 type II toxin-antitoxin system HicB family antitoxin [Moraxella bovis]UYZ88034.1 type II toxin-antitoxin system HicB family antitoxin [Moraxella bovis]UYZ90761.1 type II toxin-antitoxin system HicB family antitoxin [Moraxella bovis]